MDIMRMGKNPNYLGSWDLEDLPNKEAVLTIQSIKDESVATNGKSETCTVCYFAENGYKPMILNITNKKTLCRLYKTKSTEKLCGKAIIVGIEKVRAFGVIHDALRIRPRIPQAAQPSQTAPRCQNCGHTISASAKMDAHHVAEYTAKKYGKQLCAACATAIASSEGRQ